MHEQIYTSNEIWTILMIFMFSKLLEDFLLSFSITIGNHGVFLFYINKKICMITHFSCV